MHNHNHDERIEGCHICASKKPFKFPSGLLEEILNRDVVIFAGAGISTENPLITDKSLFEEISEELGGSSQNLEFPDIAEKFANQVNGRLKLIQKINSRIERFLRHEELYNGVTSFHTEVSTLPFFDTFITTNWDEFFERECQAKPFVYSEDIAFWDAAHRKVLKIHGTINNLGSIIVTRSDYKKCLNELKENLIGGKLKEILATKTIIYVGYSLSDPDFLELAEFVNKEIGPFKKQGYVVTVETSPKMEEKASKLNLRVIETEGSFFISKIKEKLQTPENCVLPDEVFDWILALLELTFEANEKVKSNYKIHENPEILYCLAYQNGLIHGFKRILKGRESGLSSDLHYVRSIVGWCEQQIRTLKKMKNYWHLSYFTGYFTTYLSLLEFAETGELHPPLFFGAGNKEDLMNFKKFQKFLPEIPVWNKTAQQQAKKAASKIPKNKKDPVWPYQNCEFMP